MDIYRISGGNRLYGETRVHGAKNTVLPLLAASILSNGITVIHNCPQIADVSAAMKILKNLGCTVTYEGETVIIDSSIVSSCEIPHDLMREMRSSVIFLGALLGRLGKANISAPGGCELGPRPIDMHIDALKELGADIRFDGGNLYCKAAHMRGAKITLRSSSVGATENALLAACCAEGSTVISNAAREPEIIDLAAFLNTLGIPVHGAGTSTIYIEGRRVRTSVEHTAIPDRIVAATLMCAVAATGGNITLHDVIPEHFEAVTKALCAAGCKVTAAGSIVSVKSPDTLRALKPIITEPYPGFPTDAQPQLMAACLKAEGTTSFIENIFDNRYRHADELRRFGADIKIEGRVALVTGVPSLTGASAVTPDLRGGAALIIAALSAEGESEISELKHIDRGYCKIDDTLRELGAKIDRIQK